MIWIYGCKFSAILPKDGARFIPKGGKNVSRRKKPEMRRFPMQNGRHSDKKTPVFCRKCRPLFQGCADYSFLLTLYCEGVTPMIFLKHLPKYFGSVNPVM